MTNKFDPKTAELNFRFEGWHEEEDSEGSHGTVERVYYARAPDDEEWTPVSDFPEPIAAVLWHRIRNELMLKIRR